MMETGNRLSRPDDRAGEKSQIIHFGRGAPSTAATNW